jgi:hypothetical protein
LSTLNDPVITPGESTTYPDPDIDIAGFAGLLCINVDEPVTLKLPDIVIPPVEVRLKGDNI